MAKDPAFLFYPGDYLRDTQCLSEKSQVAYDRIMCEHMRNICVSHDQLKFFTKRLNEDEIAELKMVLTEKPEGFCIDWVVESICKRKEYSESRALNRKGKKKEDMNNISKSYDKHMVIENENVIESTKEEKGGTGEKETEPLGWASELIPVILTLNWPGETRQSIERALSSEKINYGMKDVLPRKMAEYLELKKINGQTLHSLKSWINQEEFLRNFQEMIADEKAKQSKTIPQPAQPPYKKKYRLPS